MTFSASPNYFSLIQKAIALPLLETTRKPIITFFVTNKKAITFLSLLQYCFSGSSVCVMRWMGLQGMKTLYRKTFGDLCQLFSI